jgi:hypothetical protein
MKVGLDMTQLRRISLSSSSGFTSLNGIAIAISDFPLQKYQGSMTTRRLSKQ